MAHPNLLKEPPICDTNGTDFVESNICEVEAVGWQHQDSQRKAGAVCTVAYANRQLDLRCPSGTVLQVLQLVPTLVVIVVTQVGPSQFSGHWH